MTHILRKLLGWKRARPFYAWQVELTTRCSLDCAMCARSGRHDLIEADMAMDDYKRLVPDFSEVENVVLEGWGEPLLYGNLIECIRLAKEKGARAGFVTSGRPLNEAYIGELLDVGLDFIGFSFAGSTAATHNRIRRGSDFEELAEGIRLLFRKKGEGSFTVPRVHLVYLMLKDNMEELPSFIDLAAGLGGCEVVLLNQIVVTTPWQDEQRVFGSSEAEYYETILKEAAIRAAGLGIRLHRPSLFPGEVTLCDENPLRNVSVSVAGHVSPCVYLNSPEGVSFGNIFRQPWADIWNGEDYRLFRGRFEKRVRTLDEIHARLGGLGMDYPSTAGLLTEAPVPCTACRKIMGA